MRKLKFRDRISRIFKTRKTEEETRVRSKQQYFTAAQEGRKEEGGIVTLRRVTVKKVEKDESS